SERKIQESEGRFRILFEKMAQGVVYQNHLGQITHANPAAERLLGLSLDQMQGRTSSNPEWHAIKADGSPFPGEEHPAMLALKSCKSVFNVEMGVYHPKKRKHVWLMVNAEPEFREGETVPYQVFTTFSDISQLKE
ncbi:PAS domain-containing protein, partial [Arthrospira platensis SPKY1]|nr:PAS domain-containing protein [Arthrospira platensis SPKY1]